MSTSRVSDRFITFPVHDVSPVTNSLATWKTHEGINALLFASEEKGFQPILSCSGYNSNTVREVSHHGLIAAVHTAFSEHRPLALSPDMLWITIMQGVAQHVHNNSEQLRRRLVTHSGKREIVVENTAINADSPESDWQGLIDQLGDGLRNNIGETYDQLMVDFSTTGPLEKTVCAITILDTYEAYYEYVAMCICGIPSITLEGTVDDWRNLREKIEILAHFEMDKWLASLRPILDHFVRAADGDIDTEYWQNIYKLKRAYGWERINGWIARFIPYIRHYLTGAYTVANPLLEHPFTIEPDAEPEGNPSFFATVPGLIANQLPSGLALVPFKIETAVGAKDMQLIGGFVGIEQVGESQAIRPKLGWAVRQIGGIDGLLTSLAKHCEMLPPVERQLYAEYYSGLQNNTRFSGVSIPGDLLTFYRHCDGLVLPDSSMGKLRPMAELTRICLPGEHDVYAEAMQLLEEKSKEAEMTVEEFLENEKFLDRSVTVPDNRSWLAFLDYPDGSYLVFDLEHRREEPNLKPIKKVKRVDPIKGTREEVYNDFTATLEDLLSHLEGS